MKERLLHILDNTTCLTRRQMKDYLAGTMLPEEIHAAEAHIASCPLCNMALEGFEAHTEEALEAIASLNSGFLKEHFDAITPQIHLNSLSPATVITRPKKKSKTVSLGRLAAVAAIALLAVGVFWYVKYSRNDQPSGMIAQRDDTEMPVPAAAPPAAVKIADSTMAQPTTVSRSNSAALDEPAPIIKETPKPKEEAMGRLSKKEAMTAEATIADSEPAQSFAPASAEPVVATSKKYVKPLVDFKTPPQRSRTNEESEKASAKPQADMVVMKGGSFSAKPGEGGNLGGGRASNTTVVVDGVQTQDDHLKRGDEQFGAGKYSAALKSYRVEMNSSNGSRRSKASLMAAKCYINLGQKARGIELLQRVVSDGNGPQRRQAKRLLRDLEADGR